MMLMFYVVLMAFIVIGAWAAHTYEVRIRRNTIVSTAVETDYVLPGVASQASLFSTALFLGTLAVMGLTSGSVWIGLAISFAYGLLRYGLLAQYRAAAVASSDTRLSRALQRPEFAQAKFAFFLSSPDLNTPDHLTMWHDELNGLDQPWIVLFKERKHLLSFRATSSTPAVCVPRAQLFSSSLPQNAEVVFYANNGQQNRRMISAHPNKAHVQLLHGDSDKPPSYSPLTKNFSHVFVAGQMAIDRYARNGVHIPPERFRIVGRPQVSAIEQKTTNASGQKPCVVYMPTWRGFHEDTQFSSLDRADVILETLLSGPQPIDVVFKPHPMSYKDPLWKEFEEKIRATLSKKRSTGSTGNFSPDGTAPFDLYNQADIMVTDISSVLIDFLYSEKPIIVIEPANFDPTQAENFPSLEASYLVKADLKNLSEKYADAAGLDTLLEQRLRVKRLAFGDSDRIPGEAFNETCLELLLDRAKTSDRPASEGM